MAQETEKLLIEIGIDNKQVQKDAGELVNKIAELRKGTTELKAEQEKLRKENNTTSESYKANAEQIAKNEANLKQLGNELTQTQKILRAEQTEVKGSTGAYQNLQNQYAVAAQRAKDMAVAYGSNSEAAKAAASQAKAMSDKLKEVDASVGQNQRNVGNYSGALSGLMGTFENVKKKSDGFTSGIIGFSSAFKDSKNPLDLFKKGIDSTGVSMDALAKNPIIAVITILISVFNAVKDSIASSSKATNTLKEAMAPLNAIMTVAKNVTVAIVQVFLDAFLAVSKFTTAIYSFIAGNDKYSQSVKDAMAVEKERQLISKKNRELLVEEAQGNLDVAKLRDKVTEKDKYSREERKAFLNEAIAIERKMSQEKVTIAKMEYNNLVKQLRSKAELNGDEKNQLAEAKAKILNVDAEYYKSVRRMKTQAATFNKQEDEEELKRQEDAKNAEIEAKKKRAEAVQKQHEDAIKKLETTNAIYLENNKKITNEVAEQIFKNDKAVADKKLKFGKMSQEEYNLAMLQAENKLKDQKISNAEAAKKIEIDNFKNSITLADLKNQEILAGVDLTNKQLNEKALAKIENDKQLALKELEAKKLSAEEQAAAIALIEQTARTQKAVENAAFEKAESDRKLEAIKTDLDNRLAIVNEGSMAEYDLLLQKLANEQAAELANAEKTGADKQLINAKYAKLEQDLKMKTLQSNLSATSNAIGAMSGLFKKGSKAQKAAASTQIGIDSISGAMAAFKSTVGIPVIGPVLAPLAAAGVIATGIKSIKDVWAVKEDGVQGVNSSAASSGGGGGSTPSISTATGASIMRNVSGSQTAQIEAGVSGALAKTDQQTVLVIDDVTEAMNRKNTAKVQNSF